MNDSSTLLWFLGAVCLLLLLSTYWTYRLTRSLAGSSGRNRVPLPMSSGTKIRPSTSAQITAHPHRDFRPERLVISHPQDWIVNDVRIDGVSQFSQSGDVPGEMFSADAMYCWVRFDEIPGRGEFQIVVTYVGTDPEGAPFVAGALGYQRRPLWRRPRRPRADHLHALVPGEVRA